MFHKEQMQKFNYSYTDWEKLLCRIHDRIDEGAISAREIIQDLDITYPEARYRFLCENHFIKRWCAHGPANNPLNISYIILDKGIRMAKELKGFTAEDGLALLGDHN